MLTDTELKINALKILTEHLGVIETERFIGLLQKERFDYTKWQRHLFDNLTVKEISKKAMEYIKSQK